jgi:hypothetical protein
MQIFCSGSGLALALKGLMHNPVNPYKGTKPVTVNQKKVFKYLKVQTLSFTHYCLFNLSCSGCGSFSSSAKSIASSTQTVECFDVCSDKKECSPTNIFSYIFD